MSTTIDERVVEMRFDHSDFKKNAGETVSLLEKLKNALNFSGSSGLDELNKSARNVDLNPLTRSVEAVHQSFTAFEVAAITALVNITNRAVDAGVSLVKSLSIDQVTEGWDKYAQKTSSVQTIMAATAQDFSNTGEQMAYVNEQLEKLNWFTDETSYNFVDMVSNIGKFTANNIALDDSVTAMQGIATWAALSGANATEASRAMYNLSQAVAVGSVKLIDWKSIENANMATAQFKETALETASSMGLLKKTAKGVYQTIEKGTEVSIANFNSALSEGWFTSEVLLATLDKYGAFTNVLNEVSEASGFTATELLSWMDAYRSAGNNTEKVLKDMEAECRRSGITVRDLSEFMDELTDSTYELGEKAFRAAQEAKTFEEAINATKDAVSTGWMNTWEIVFGDYEQAKKIWTGLAEELYEVFASGAERRNELLKEALGLPDQYLDRSSSSWNNLVKQIEKAGLSGEEFANQCYEIGKQLGLLDEWSLTSFDDLRKSLESGWFTSETLIATINSMMGPFANASEVVKDASHTFDDFRKVLGRLNRGELGEGDELLKNLAESGWNVVAVQEAANKLLEQGEVTIDDYNAALQEMSIRQYEKLGYEKDTIENLKRLRAAYKDTTLTIIDDGDAISKWWTGTELLFTGIAQAWNAIKGIFSAIGKGWEIAFPPMTADRLYRILEMFKNLTSTFNQWVHGYVTEDGEEILGITENISDSVSGLASIFGLVVDVVKELGRYVSETFGGAFGSGIKSVLRFTGSIGQWLVAARNWIKENKIIRTGIEAVASWVSKASTEVRGWIGSFIEFPFVQNVIIEIKNGFQKFVDLIQRTFPRVSSLIGDLRKKTTSFRSAINFDRIVQLIKNLAKALKEDLSDAFKSLEGRFPKITELFTKITSSIKNLNMSGFPKWAQGLYNVAAAFLTPVIGIFSSFIEMLKNAAEDADNIFDFLADITGQFGKAISENFGAIVAAFVAYKVGSTLANFAKSLWSVLNLLSSPIKAIVSAFNNFTSAVKTVGKSLSHSFNAFAVIEAAVAVAILGHTLIQLGKMEDADLEKAKNAIFLLSGVIAGLLVLVGLLDQGGLKANTKKVKIQSNAALSLVTLAASIYLVVRAFIKLSEILKGAKLETLTAPLITLGSVAIALVGLAALFNKLGGSAGLGGALSMLALAGSVLMIVSALNDILEFINGVVGNTLIGERSTKITQVMNVLLGIAASLAILMLGLGAFNKFSSGGGAKIAAGLLASVVAIKILVSIVKDINELLSIEGSEKAIDLLGWLAVGIMAFMATLGAIGSAGYSAGVGLLAASAGIWILVDVIKRLSSMKASDIFKGTIAIGALLIFMGLMTRIAGSAKAFDSLKAGASFLAISASLVILTGAIALMSLIDPGRLAVATGAMSILMVAFGILLACASLVKDVKPAYFVSLAIVLTVLAGSVIILGSMNPESVFIGVAAMTVLMTAVSIMMLLARAIKNVPVSPLVTIGIIVAVLAGAIWALASLNNPTGIAVATSSLVTAMAAFSVMFLVLGITTRIAGQFSTSALVALGLIGVIVAGLALVIGYLVDKIGIAGAGAALLITEGLKDLMLGLTTMMAGVAVLGRLNWQQLAVGLVGLVGIIAIFATVFALIGALGDKCEDASSASEKAFPLLRNIGRAIGEIAAGFIEALLSINTGGLTDKLTSFGDAISGFVEQIKGIDESAVSAVKSVVELLMLMAGADLVNAITSWFGGDTTSLSSFGEELKTFGPMLAEFSDSVSGDKIDPDAIQKAADASKSLTDLAKNLPRSGGFVGTLIGDRESLGRFSLDVVTFGTALVGFCKALSENGGFDPELIEKSATAANKLADLQNELPSLNGWSQKITGNPQTLSEFGTGLSIFGEALSGYSVELGKVTDWDLFDTAVTATESIVELSGKLGTDDGFIGKIFGGGQTDLGEFGKTLKKFAQGLVDYSTTAADINPNGLDNANKIVTDMLLIVNDVSIGKANKLENLGKYIVGLGADLFEYNANISLVNTEKMSLIATNLTSLVSIIQGMSDITSTSTSGFTKALTSLASISLDDFCAVFENSLERITSAINIVATNATIAVTNASTDFTTAGIYSVTAYLNGLISDKADFNGTVKVMTKKILDTLESFSGDYEKVGELLTKNFMNGLTFDLTGLFYTGVNLANQTLLGMAAPTVEKDSYTLGSNFAIGFHNGMVSGYSLVANAAYSLGRAAVSNLQAAIDAHSPSRETESLGEFAGAGFVNGMLSYLQKAGNAGEGLGQEAINNLKSAIQNVPYLLANDLDLNPVIRPIIDLTGAQESTAMLNSMFNRSVGVSADLAGMTGGSFERARVGVAVGSGDKDVNSASGGTQEQNVQYNTFNITSNDPEAVANAVSRILQKQVERKESTWAQSSGTGYPRVRSRS